MLFYDFWEHGTNFYSSKPSFSCNFRNFYWFSIESLVNRRIGLCTDTENLNKINGNTRKIEISMKMTVYCCRNLSRAPKSHKMSLEMIYNQFPARHTIVGFTLWSPLAVRYLRNHLPQGGLVEPPQHKYFEITTPNNFPDDMRVTQDTRRLLGRRN